MSFFIISFMAKRSQNEVNSLTRRALELLDRGHSEKEVAEILDVSLRTIQRWKARLEIEESNIPIGIDSPRLLSPQEERALGVLTFGEVEKLIPNAVAVIKEILENPESRNSDRLRAAGLIGDWSGYSSGVQGAMSIVLRAGYIVVDPDLEQSGQRSQGLTEEGANLIRAKLLGIEE